MKPDELFSKEESIWARAVECLDQIQLEGENFRVLNELMGQYKKLIRKTRKLVRLDDFQQAQLNKEIEQRTHAEEVLKAQRQSLQILLDHAGQAFMGVTPDLMVEHEHSKETERIFGRTVAGEDICNLLAPESKKQKEHIENVLSAAFHNPAKRANLYLSLLPEQIHIRNLVLQVKTRVAVVAKNGMPEKLVLILTDITEKTQLRERMEREHEAYQIVMHSVRHRNKLRECLTLYHNFVENFINMRSHMNVEDISEIIREIHTFKGLFGLFYFNRVRDYLHLLEDHINALQQKDEELKAYLGSIKPWQMRRPVLRDIAYIIKHVGDDYLNDGESKSRIQYFDEFIHLLKGQLPDESCEKIDACIDRVRGLVHVRDLMHSYALIVPSLAEKLGKRVYPVGFEGDNFFVNEHKYRMFFNILIHVFNNIVDHGIEFSEERIARGKDPIGLVHCEFSLKSDGFAIRICDDGKGFDLSVLKDKLMKKHQIAKDLAEQMSDQEFYDLMLKSPVSSRNSVTLTSGRGVGLATVRTEVEKMGGTMHIHSLADKGSCFDFYFKDDLVVAKSV
jgi:two-component system, chemotaxis family, sensor kinase CheA